MASYALQRRLGWHTQSRLGQKQAGVELRLNHRLWQLACTAGISWVENAIWFSQEYYIIQQDIAEQCHTRKKLGGEKNLGPKKNVGPQNYLETQKNVGPKRNLVPEKMWVPKKIWGLKKIWSRKKSGLQKKSGFQKILGPRIFFGVHKKLGHEKNVMNLSFKFG